MCASWLKTGELQKPRLSHRPENRGISPLESGGRGGEKPVSWGLMGQYLSGPDKNNTFLCGGFAFLQVCFLLRAGPHPLSTAGDEDGDPPSS